MEPVAEIAVLELFEAGHVGDVLHSDGQDAHVGGQHAGVAVMRCQCLRSARRIGSEVDADAGTSQHAGGGHALDELVERHVPGGQSLSGDAPTLEPRRESDEQQDADQQREPATGGDLRDVGGQEAQVDGEEQPGERRCLGEGPLPAVSGHRIEQHRGDGHRAGDRESVGAGEVRRGAEPNHQSDATDQQREVDDRYVDLALLVLGGVSDLHPGQVPEQHRLLGQRERTADQGLRGDHGGAGRQDDQRHQRPTRTHPVEGVVDVFGVGQEHGALAEVVEQQAGQDQAVPAPLDRLAAEVAHVGVQRLAPGDHQEHRAEREESGQPVADQEVHAEHRVDRPEDARCVDDVRNAEDGEHAEPEDHHRTEEATDRGGAVALDGEERHQDHDGDRDHQ